jgi:hypothetical protein
MHAGTNATSPLSNVAFIAFRSPMPAGFDLAFLGSILAPAKDECLITPPGFVFSAFFGGGQEHCF